MSLIAPRPAERRRNRWLYGGLSCAVVMLVCIGVFAKNGWFPQTDGLTGKRTGWFGQPVAKNAPSSWNPVASVMTTPTPTPQLSKEYVYAGSRLLAVEDANANAAPPADLAVWRPSDGNWFVLGGPGSQQVTQSWGAPTDIPVQGDYDGDGKTDFAVWRPSSGQWFIIRSSDGQVIVTTWGLPTDVPVAADFDGDGRTDVTQYRPSTGKWFIIRSSDNNVSDPTFGTQTDIPTPKDFDGDGKADVAFWRPSDKSFYILRSTDGQTQQVTISSAPSTAKPVPADFDGDGKADCALFDDIIDEQVNLVDPDWYIFTSSDQTAHTYRYGTAGDVPVPNDYDGDGKADIAVWRPAVNNGTWWILQSGTNSTRSVQWGTTGDIPVPAYYRR